MITFLRNLFSIYINPFEKELDSFFSSLSENSSKTKIKESLINFMQKDMISLCLYIERKYKGYKYLNKKNRRRYLYNSMRLTEFFNEFIVNTKFSHDQILNIMKCLDIDIDKTKIDLNKLIVLWKICLFFQSKVKYVYQESTSFGLLLEDPVDGMIMGDCNQIVSLYIYLYSRVFDIKDLSLSIYKNHVCINYQGVDVEATLSVIRPKNKDIIKVVPVEEILSINILDINDISKSTFKLSKHSLLESSRLAYIISSERDIVTNNLLNSYKNISVYYLQHTDYELSLNYALRSKDRDFYNKIVSNIVQLLTDKKLFDKADFYRRLYPDSKLDLYLFKNWGSYLFNKHYYDQAILKFQNIKDQDSIKLCYKAKYIELQNKIRNVKTLNDLKRHKSTIMKMREYAKRSSDKDIIVRTEFLVSQLKIN